MSPDKEEVLEALRFTPRRGAFWRVMDSVGLFLAGFFASQALHGVIESHGAPLNVLWLVLWVLGAVFMAVSIFALETAMHRVYRAQLQLVSELGIAALSMVKNETKEES